MTLMRTLLKMRLLGRGVVLAAMALVLTACAAVETDDTTGSALTQPPPPPPGTPPRQPVDANDIVIVGQLVAHSIMDLPAVADAANPPLVQFNGVTSIISGPVPVDTDPYTELFRDRLLLLTREKLRFVEHTLPPLIIAHPQKSKKKKATAPVPEMVEDPDYQVLAEMRGRYEDDLFKIQVQFVDAHTGDVLFDELYRIRKEEAPAPPVAVPVATPDDSTTPPDQDMTTPPSETGNPAPE
jgi:hypothetical protein